ncbi:MAG: S46 family peptidase [Bacteroidetes bacterium]|nr:S46 family peptidase [Bacteroidota bacterium]
MKKFSSLLLLILISVTTFSQQLWNNQQKEIKAGRFDTGRMWTFDTPPTNYFAEEYNFTANKEWFDHVRLSTLRIPGCTASFISEDGLIITNYHCSDFHVDKYEKEGEDIFETGFYAASREEERIVPGFHADRLEFIVDVTEEIHSAIAEGMTEDEKIKKKDVKVEELIKKYDEETGLTCELVTMYNGGKYSIYGYKIYNDVRIVFIPEWNAGQFGGNEDNFTYPRYTLDFTLYRVYDDEGNPLKVEHYYKFNPDGPKPDDVLFSIGNPGSTSRLLTISQLEYLRDVIYRNYSYFYDTYYNRLEMAKSKYPEKAELFEDIRQIYGNGQKALVGFYKGLMDTYFMKRKGDFENKFKAAVLGNEKLTDEYGHLWKAIEIATSERRKYGNKLAAYSMSRRRHSVYFDIAKKVLDYSEQMNMDKEDLDESDSSKNIEDFVTELYGKNFDKEREIILLGVQVDYMLMNAPDDENILRFTNNKKSCEAAEAIIAGSILETPEKLIKYLSDADNNILMADDPFVTFLLNTKDELAEINLKETEITNSITIYQDLLGRALYEVYGNEIPPDANFTLRITDGRVMDYQYNGTIAPVFTTFYGMYNRYYSHQKKYPWLMPAKWLENEKNLDLSTHFNFLSTFDLVGGSSGSPVINKNAEYVGIAFDGNIESLNGDFIYLPDINRSISLSSSAIIESLKSIYKAERVVDEITEGKIAE